MPKFVNVVEPKKVEKVAKNFQPSTITLINDPYNFKYGSTPYTKGLCNLQYVKPEFKIPVPGEGLPRIIHYCADQSGCAFWRMIWPGDELLTHNKAAVMTLYQMVQFAPFYVGIDTIRLQRQCTEHQRDFIKWLRQVSDEMKRQTGKGFKIIWECDDVTFPFASIPEYNACRTAFKEEIIQKTVIDILSYVDEMTVVSMRMKEHYEKHTGFKKISVIPNYLPKPMIDIGFDVERVMENYEANKHRPRVVYAGSSTHFDVTNACGQKDDFYHIVDHIIADINGPNKYQWVFLGGFPLKLMPYVQNGRIEYHQWGAISDYLELLRNLKGNVMIAPLMDNDFSQSKANIKLTEGGTVGMPVVAQNLDCYSRSDKWPWLFDTAEEMFAHIDDLMSDASKYKEAVLFAKDLSKQYHLKDHLDELMVIYTTPYGDEKRREHAGFVKNNPTQCI
jgi:ASC-1-like (ASCH) protein